MAQRLLGVCLGMVIVLSTATAQARSSQDFEYGFDQLWRASVRLVAVDFRFPITDRDPEIGYLLFQYTESGRTYEASLELVRVNEAEPASPVRVVVQVGSMPSYVERMLLDRLARKLREDYGAPVRRPTPRPAERPTPPAAPTPAPPGPSEPPDDPS